MIQVGLKRLEPVLLLNIQAVFYLTAEIDAMSNLLKMRMRMKTSMPKSLINACILHLY